MDKEKTIILTTFYNRTALSSYAMAMYQTGLVMREMEMDYDFWGQDAGFHVAVSINSALTKFAKSDATQIILVDADETWEPADLVKLAFHKEDVIGGTYRMKNKWGKYVGEIKKTDDGGVVGKLLSENVALVEAEVLAAGFLKIRKNVLLKYIETHPDNYFYIENEKIYRFFWDEIIDHGFVGMDYCFCRKLKELGYKLWIDPTLRISHWGMSEFKGDYDKYLRSQKAINTVRELAEDGKRAL